MRCSSFCLMFALTTSSLLAQVKTGESHTPQSISSSDPSPQLQPSEAPASFFATLASHGCPIAISADRHSPAAISTIGTLRTTPRNQAVQLRFHQFYGPKIEQVTVVVHGFSQESRIMPLDTERTSDVAETFQLRRSELAASLVASYLQPTRVFITQWIELKNVGYTDGSTWHASRSAECTVTPSKLALLHH